MTGCRDVPEQRVRARREPPTTLAVVAVHLTRIYTRTGDDGTSGLSDFSRVPKTDPRLVAYADCDEANAAIGVALTLGAPTPDIAKILRHLQNDLFDAGADLATPLTDDNKGPTLRIT